MAEIIKFNGRTYRHKDGWELSHTNGGLGPLRPADHYVEVKEDDSDRRV